MIMFSPAIIIGLYCTGNNTNVVVSVQLANFVKSTMVYNTLICDVA